MTPASPPPLDLDPLLARALYALVSEPILAVPRAVAPGEVRLVLDGARIVVVLRAEESDAARVAEWLRALQTDLPRKVSLDLVVLGGGAGVREAVRRAPPTVMLDREVGAAHLDDAGDLYASRVLDGRVRDAIARVGADRGAPAPETEVLRAALASAARHGAAQQAELDAFSATMRTRRPYAAGALVGANVLVYVLEQLWGGDHGATLVRMGADVPALVKSGEVYRLIAHAFLHASPQHLAFNLIALWSFGGFFERLLGTSRTLVLYTLAALGGGLATVLASKATVTVGASGAIFGFLGAAGALALRPGDTLPEAMRPAFRRNIAINLVLQLAVSLTPNVSLSAHVGGALVGFVLLYTGALRPPRGEGAVQEPGASGWIRSQGGAGWLVAAGVAALVLAAGPVWAIARGTPWTVGRLDFARYSLAGTPWSVELPSAPRAVGRHDDAREFEVGDVANDGYVMDLVTRPLAQPVAREETEQAAGELVAVQNGLGHPRDVTADGPPERTVIGGWPTVVQRFHAENGARFANWVQIRSGGTISAQILHREDAGAAVAQIPNRVLASARGP